MAKTPDTPAQLLTSKRPARRPSLVKSVRDALLHFGGEAHRGMVIDHVARDLGHEAGKAPEDLKKALIRSFEIACRNERRRAAYGFRLPFGEGSHRWGVSVH